LPDVKLLAGYPHLVVVADPRITPLPVAALAADGETLVAAHDVTMSLTLRDALRIATLPDARRRVDLSRIALFSDPVFTPYDTRMQKKPDSVAAFPALPRLANTAGEVRAIAAQLGSVKMLQFSGFEATRDAALSRPVAQASVLHFATHAYASDQWPNGSGLQLTGFKPSGEPINGFVSTLDLLSRRASTDLVVLSACDTARGDAAPGENVAGLARAFLGGGARRVVATLWRVDDAVTAQLMQKFYGGLAAGNTPAAALSAAQRSFVSHETTSARPAWAAFVLYERAPGG
jgi:CHAT domain-containing protein